MPSRASVTRGSSRRKRVDCGSLVGSNCTAQSLMAQLALTYAKSSRQMRCPLQISTLTRHHACAPRLRTAGRRRPKATPARLTRATHSRFGASSSHTHCRRVGTAVLRQCEPNGNLTPPDRIPHCLTPTANFWRSQRATRSLDAGSTKAMVLTYGNHT